MPLSARDLERLKKPFGKLIADVDISEKRVRASIASARKVIAVGDATTERLSSFKIIPDIAVVDGLERRSKRDFPAGYQAKEMRCANPSGTISRDAIKALRTAIRTEHPVRVIVDGEEDLLALPLFFLAPVSSIVLYGQPLEGMVVVRITAQKKREAKELLEKLWGRSILKDLQARKG